MTDDAKRTQKLLVPEELEPPRRRAPSFSDDAPIFEDEESSTRDTDAAISIPPTTPREQRTRAVLTVVSGTATGKVHTVEGDTILGRGRDAQVRLDDAGTSRAHARVRPTANGTFEIEDLGSLNGTFLDGRRVTRAPLQSGDRIHIGPNVVVTFAVLDAQAERIAAQLYESSVRDPLTRAHNRRHLVERLASEIAYASRHKTPLGLILIDVDHFKRVNDTHGHLAGDEVLRELAALVQRMIRAEDVFARFGGEEFVVLVRGIEHDNVGRFAERIRAAVERLEVPIDSATGGVLHLTISLGFASFTELDAGERTADGLLRLADVRLYRSKQAGRNRVTGA